LHPYTVGRVSACHTKGKQTERAETAEGGMEERTNSKENKSVVFFLFLLYYFAYRKN
jgi:hypothetical protein